MKGQLRLAVFFGNRGFFPGEVIAEARKEMREAITKAGFIPVLMDESLTRYGAVESTQESKLFASFLEEEKPDGVVICLPNFGDETAASIACRDAGVPILVQAYPDTVGSMDFAHRRDAFCGKLSLMDVFLQYKIPFSANTPHVIHPLNEKFIQQLKDFGGVCRVVKGMKRCTVLALGARTSAFKTVRYDEIALQKYGITVETVDLSEVLGKANALSSDSIEVEKQIKALHEFADCSDAPSESLLKMAKLKIVIEAYIEELDADMVAIRCWNELEVYYGCAPCAIAGILGDVGVPVACEVDVTNAVMMYALNLATGSASTILDWNNNVGEEDDSCILFHCGPVPNSMVTKKGKMVEHPMFAKTYGPGCGWGPVVTRLKPGEFSFASSKTEDGKFVTYFGNGVVLPDEIEEKFFGTCGIVSIDNLQEKLLAIGKSGFRHHVAISYGNAAHILKEAFTTYLGYEVVNLP